jgi:hypothetical protein
MIEILKVLSGTKIEGFFIRQNNFRPAPGFGALPEMQVWQGFWGNLRRSYNIVFLALPLKHAASKGFRGVRLKCRQDKPFRGIGNKTEIRKF